MSCSAQKTKWLERHHLQRASAPPYFWERIYRPFRELGAPRQRPFWERIRALAGATGAQPNVISGQSELFHSDQAESCVCRREQAGETKTLLHRQTRAPATRAFCLRAAQKPPPTLPGS